MLSVYGSVDSYLAGVLDRKARVLREVLDGRQPDDVELITELMKVSKEKIKREPRYHKL